VSGIGEQRAGIDALSDGALVAGHGQIADDADDRPGDARPDVRSGAMPDELADALIAGERRAGPDDRRDPDPRANLGSGSGEAQFPVEDFG
jgi:hypothetical protein